MLTINDPEIEQFIREESARTGRAPADVLRRFLPSPLSTDAEHGTVVAPDEQARRVAVVRAIQARLADLPRLDDRSMDEIVGYDEDGLPT